IIRPRPARAPCSRLPATATTATVKSPSRERVMVNHRVLDLAACTEFRQTLQARPPRLVHGTALLLGALLAAALTWSAVTEADLVVRAPRPVRPITRPPSH